MRYILLVLVAFFIYNNNIKAQQAELTLVDCEELFQKNNLLLLAEQYNIDASRAAVIQAKIWEHPYFSGSLNLINPERGRVFDIGQQGQKIFAVEQLIYLGGKKKKEIAFARNNTRLAELQYEQLLWNLKFEIRHNFYEIYFNQVKTESLNFQLENLDSLISAYNVQAQKGNVPIKDVVRLRSLAFSFKSQLMEIRKHTFGLQENLKILTNTPDNIIAVADTVRINERCNNSLDYLEVNLQELTSERNPEYLLALEFVQNNELLLNWQKSMAVPDITLGLSYEQQGAFNNEVNFTFGIPLAFLWNKNKGNIKIVEAQISQSNVYKDQKLVEIRARVSNAYQAFMYQQQQYNEIIISLQDFETVYNGILSNVRKNNISLLEFTDFMESYNESILIVNEIKKELIISGETLNYLTNQQLF